MIAQDNSLDIQQLPDQTNPDMINSPINYSDNINSEDYISQFLSIPSLPDHDMDTLFKKNGQIPTDELLFKDEDLFNSPPSDGTMKKQRMKSAFHNFQKHLVTTLRHSIKMEQLFTNPGAWEVEKKLWELFMKSPKMTRSLLYVVYGGIDMESGKNKKIAKQFGMNTILKGESMSKILEAQKNLRDQTFKQAQQINLEWELGYRRMRNKKDFKVYFMAFLEELKEGNFNKRIPKEKRKKLQEQQMGEQ